VARGERAGRGLPLILPQGRQRLQGQGPPEGRSRQRCVAPLGLEGSTRRLRRSSGGDHGDHPMPVMGWLGCAGRWALWLRTGWVVVRRKVRRVSSSSSTVMSGECVSGPTCRLTFLSQVMLDVRARKRRGPRVPRGLVVDLGS
jgi:hypothetical protein